MKRDRSPEWKVEQKGRFTVLTEEVPDNEPKRGRPEHQEEAGPSTQHPAPQQQTAPADQQPAQQPPPPQEAAQQAQQAPPGPEPRQPGGGNEKQGAADPDRPPPEPPPLDVRDLPQDGGASARFFDSVPPRTDGGMGGRRELRKHGENERGRRNQYGYLFSFLSFREGFYLDAIHAVQAFKGIDTAVERNLIRELLAISEDMIMNSSSTVQSAIKAFPGILHPNIKFRLNVVSPGDMTTTASDSWLTKMMAIFTAGFDSNIAIQGSVCSHFVKLGKYHAKFWRIRIIAYHGNGWGLFHVWKYTMASAVSNSQ